MKYSVSFSFVSLVLIFIFTSCEHIEKNNAHQQISSASIKTGEKLAKVYCASCHQLPDPSLVDSKSWENGVLPQMGPRLGIFSYGSKVYPSFQHDLSVDKNFYPKTPVLSYADWQHIIDYYTATSPDSLLPAKNNFAITNNDSIFKPLTPAFKYEMPTASYIKVNPGKGIEMCDAFSGNMFVFNNSLQLTDSIKTKGSVADVIDDSLGYIFCSTGILSPNNGKYGSVKQFIIKDKSTKILFKNLMRPVQLTSCDLNEDGKKDFLVCEFGNLQGALSWLEKSDTGYVRHVLRGAPGAIKAYVDDYNHDGHPDVWALFAQGDESIFLFTNKGNAQFDARQVLRFPPSYGSSHFDLADFDNNGYPDIVYTCGDNADYSPVLKPYHGVYIYLNDGKNNFTQKYFYALNGCYKAIAKDFDNDGDLDIATISFFADFKNHPENGFVYFRNDGNFNFKPYSLFETKYGRWLTMDAGDFDGDGKTDLVLGNFSLMDPVFKAGINWKQGPPFLLLKNIQ